MNENTLYGTTVSFDNWIGDGKEGATIVNQGEEQELQMLHIHGGQRGTPFNCHLDVSKESECEDDYFFQVSILEMSGSLSVGVVTPCEFQPGWRIKGMFYNGNLTNGSAALAVSWGPRFGVGDSVGVRLRSTSENVEVTFYKNGESLGTGFSIKTSSLQLYCPCLIVDGNVTIEFTIPEELPSLEIVKEQEVSIPGRWKLLDATKEDDSAIVIPRRPITLEIWRDEMTVKFAFRVGNNISGSAKILNDTGNTWMIESVGMMSTLIGLPPDLQKIECFIGNLNPNTVSLENGKLTLRNGPKSTVWERNERKPLALSNYYVVSFHLLSILQPITASYRLIDLSMIRQLLFALIMSIIAHCRAEFSGGWILKSALQDDATVEFPPGGVTLELILKDDGYDVAFRAGNHIRGSMIVDDEISDVEIGVHFSAMASTRMLPPQELRGIEKFISKAIPLMTEVTINDIGDLVMQGPSVEAVFSPAGGDQGNA